MLTLRERRVWQMWRAGYTIKETALHVGVSEAMARLMLKRAQERLPLTFLHRD